MNILRLLLDLDFIIAALAAVAVMATVITLAMPLLSRNEMKQKMKDVALERDKIRSRERARLAETTRASLRSEPKAYMKQTVEKFNLMERLTNEETQNKLKQAGFRGGGALTVYVFSRFIAPFVMFAVTLFYIFMVANFNMTPMTKMMIALVAGAAGLYLPDIYLKNLATKRQVSIRRAWPDALDMMLICVESGMSLDHAIQKVAQEIGLASVPLAEEFSLTAAELSYLEERRTALENLSNRTGLDQVKAVMTALIQAERYGTPVGHALRVLADESRAMRMAEAEKKAAALPPKLTVPMILFFLPVVFVVLVGPAIIQVQGI